MDIRVFDAGGELRAKIPEALTLCPDETRVLVMARVLASVGIGEPFRGMVEARLSPRRDQAVMPGPGMFNVNTLWSAGGAVTQSTNQSLGHANSRCATPHFLSPKRTKMFGRVVANQDYETMLSLMNPSSEEGYATPSDTKIEVRDASGARHRYSTLVIPPVESGCRAPVTPASRTVTAAGTWPMSAASSPSPTAPMACSTEITRRGRRVRSSALSAPVMDGSPWPGLRH